jgi:hypothetical protein
MSISLLKVHYVTVKLLSASMFGYVFEQPQPLLEIQVLPAAFEAQTSWKLKAEDPESANLYACVVEGIRIVAVLKQRGWPVRAECSGSGNEMPSPLAGWHPPRRYNYAESMITIIEREFAIRSKRTDRY